MTKIRKLTPANAVLSCTVALFLSGYAIQQRTLNQLRASIRPRERRAPPQTYLPERFRTTKVLDDGTIVQIESEVERERREQREALEASESRRQKEQMIEVTTTNTHGENPAVSSEKLAMVEALMAQAAQKSWAVEHPDPLVKSKVPITRAERRRLIKEEMQKLARSDEPLYYQRRLW